MQYVVQTAKSDDEQNKPDENMRLHPKTTE
jgi:hypothetical protein